MQCHRIEELIELLQPVWMQHQELNMTQLLAKLATDAGYEGKLNEISDDLLIYHLKMLGEDKSAMIPGLAKDTEVDFKAAMLKARGVE